MQKPGTLDIVAITLQTPRPACPVHLEEQVEMMGLWIQDVICEDADKVS